MKRLHGLKITRVDLVDKGANQGAHVMIFKTAADYEKANVLDVEKVDGIAKAFESTGKGTYADGLCSVMTHSPETYQAYRRSAFKRV